MGVRLSPRLMDRRRVLIAKLTSLFKNIISSETGIASFNTNFAKPMKVVCEFSPKQEGTGDPSPENIRPISAWDGANINSTKKNLFNKDSTPLASKKYIDSANKGQRYGLTDHENYNVYKIPVKEGIQYTFGKLYANQPNWAFVDDQGIVIHAEANYGGTTGRICTWTAPPGSTALLLSVAVFGQYKFDDTLQVEINSIESDYEYYQGTTLPIPFNNPGTYDFLPIQAGTGDPSPENVRPITPGLTFTRDDNTTLEVWGGSLTVNADGTGSLSSQYYSLDCKSIDWVLRNGASSDIVYFYNYRSADVPECLYSSGQINLCKNVEKYSHGTIENPYSFKINAGWAFSTVARIGFADGSNIDTIEKFNAWLNDQEVCQIVYPLKEPTTYTLSVSETSRAFEALGLGKNLGPLYGGAVTLNEDGSVDVVSEYAMNIIKSISAYPYRPYYSAYYTPSPSMVSGNALQKGISSYLPRTSELDNSVLKPSIFFGWNDDPNRVYLWRIGELVANSLSIDVSNVTSTQVNQYLTENPLTIIYPLKTPIEYHFSSVADFKSFIGSNNIWSDLNGPITVEYYNNKKE